MNFVAKGTKLDLDYALTVTLFSILKLKEKKSYVLYVFFFGIKIHMVSENYIGYPDSN